MPPKTAWRYASRETLRFKRLYQTKKNWNKQVMMFYKIQIQNFALKEKNKRLKGRVLDLMLISYIIYIYIYIICI